MDGTHPYNINAADFFAESLDSRLIREDSGIEVLSSLYAARKPGRETVSVAREKWPGTTSVSIRSIRQAGND
jgi:hypothetical protein